MSLDEALPVLARNCHMGCPRWARNKYNGAVGRVGAVVVATITMHSAVRAALDYRTVERTAKLNVGAPTLESETGNQ